MNSDEEPPKGTNAQEEKELRRVFDHLAHYRDKRRLQAQIQEKKERRSQLEASNKDPRGTPIIDANGNRMSEEHMSIELEKITFDLEKKVSELNAVQNNPNKSIRHEDLSDAIKALGKTCSRKQINDMIWEADENLDNCVDWEELKGMFNRNLMDKTGLEPVNLFNVIQFMTYDKKLCGTITADDTMAILFGRYGRAQLEPRMKQLFCKGDELTFVDYLDRVDKRGKRNKTFPNSAPENQQ